MIVELFFIAFQWIREKLQTDKVLPKIKKVISGFFHIFFNTGYDFTGLSFEIGHRSLKLKERLIYYKFRPSPGFLIEIEEDQCIYKNIVLGKDKSKGLVILQCFEMKQLPVGATNNVFGASGFHGNIFNPSPSVDGAIQHEYSSREELYGYARIKKT